MLLTLPLSFSNTGSAFVHFNTGVSSMGYAIPFLMIMYFICGLTVCSFDALPK